MPPLTTQFVSANVRYITVMFCLNYSPLLFVDAGFDVILVESVGVGQSELSLSDLVDIYTLLVAPGAGDELQVQP